MVKQRFYCVPYDKAVKKSRNGVAYHCEVDKKAAAQIDISSSQSAVKCSVCNKEFKDVRCLKIHKTKKEHWGSSVNDPENGPKRPTQYHRNIGRGAASAFPGTPVQGAQDPPAPAPVIPKRKRKQSSPKPSKRLAKVNNANA
jgi:hypothetical protein